MSGLLLFAWVAAALFRLAAPQLSNSVFMFADWVGCPSAGIGFVPSMVNDTVRAIEGVNAMYAACSYGAHPEFLMDPSKILVRPFSIPCYGIWGKFGSKALTYDYSVNGCGGLDATSLVEAAFVPDGDVRFIYYMNVPYNPKDYSRCFWAGGSAVISSGGVGKAYIGTLKIGDASSLIHENGHMFTLMHPVATAALNDGSSPMGHGGPTTCYNAPESSVLGWSTALASLNVTADDRWREFALPIFSASPQNHVVVDLQQGNGHRLFLSVRSKEGNANADQTLEPLYEKTISVHSYARASGFKFNANLKSDPALTYVIATIPAGGTFDFRDASSWMQDPSTAPSHFSLPRPANIGIKHTHYSPGTGSTVAICFYTDSIAGCGCQCPP
jgi:hypothetical protein